MRTSPRLWYAVAVAVLLLPVPTMAQNDLHQNDLHQNDLHQEDRQALLKILSDVETAINAQDVEGILAQMRPD